MLSTALCPETARCPGKSFTTWRSARTGCIPVNTYLMYISGRILAASLTIAFLSIGKQCNGARYADVGIHKDATHISGGRGRCHRVHASTRSGRQTLPARLRHVPGPQEGSRKAKSGLSLPRFHYRRGGSFTR